jgi:hypothetical protein
MDNRYHLFIKTLLPSITEGMHYLNASYSNWFKAKHKIVGVILKFYPDFIAGAQDTLKFYCDTFIYAYILWVK